MSFCGLRNNHMTSFGHVLVVVAASLLCCSFAVTGEAIPTAKIVETYVR